jgi:hypothetical protein
MLFSPSPLFSSFSYGTEYGFYLSMCFLYLAKFFCMTAGLNIKKHICLNDN